MKRSVRFPDEIDARLVAEAGRLDRSVSWVVLRAVEKALGAEQLHEPPSGPASSRRPVETPHVRVSGSQSPSLKRFKPS